jgi:CubicO group peptidase (beta-lactamase class C family)
MFFIVESGEGIARTQEPSLQSTIAALGNEISSTLEDHNVAGLAVATVDKQGILWCHGFGVTDYRDGQTVTPDTIFSI